MKITEKISLLYPDDDARIYAEQRRKTQAALPQNYIDDLEAYRTAVQLLPSQTDIVMNLMREFSDHIPTLEYRLDCLEDFLREPRLADSLRPIIRRLSDNNTALGELRGKADSFMEIHLRMDQLREFVACVEDIKTLWRKISGRITSEAVKSLFGYFTGLDEVPEYIEMKQELDTLSQVFSKSVRSVRIGINFTHDMIPDSCGILEVSDNKIYPRSGILDKLIFRTYEGHEQFIGEEHLNTRTRSLSHDLDTALFRELEKYTREFARRVADALAARRQLFLEDINVLGHQLDLYEGAVRMISYVRARGLEMCRPKLLPAQLRKVSIKGLFDPVLFRRLANADHVKRGDELIVTNDLTLDGRARFMLVTGANNGGKTTFARAFGMCRLLAQCGLYVPAREAELSVCDHIYTHFPKEEETGINTSRFTEEIRSLAVICGSITPRSTVIMNESLQSTTPEECLDIARAHMEIMAAAGVSGLYVTHLNSLYGRAEELNAKGYPTRFGSLVAGADEKTGERSYKLTARPPMPQSLASAIYTQYGAKLEDVLTRLKEKRPS
ncbi:MAG: hypothetical protein IKN17_00180 [Ruminococcus sp.]|nr:hypothetical protein [Ruminococcus sp.]